MYRLQRGNQWENGTGNITVVGETDLTIEESNGSTRTVPIASVQGWVRDPLMPFEAPVEEPAPDA